MVKLDGERRRRRHSFKLRGRDLGIKCIGKCLRRFARRLCRTSSALHHVLSPRINPSDARTSSEYELGVGVAGLPPKMYVISALVARAGARAVSCLGFFVQDVLRVRVSCRITSNKGNLRFELIQLGYAYKDCQVKLAEPRESSRVERRLEGHEVK